MPFCAEEHLFQGVKDKLEFHFFSESGREENFKVVIVENIIVFADRCGIFCFQETIDPGFIPCEFNGRRIFDRSAAAFWIHQFHGLDFCPERFVSFSVDGDFVSAEELINAVNRAFIGELIFHGFNGFFP